MNAKEYLEQGILLDKRINCKLEQLSSLKDLAAHTTSVMGNEVVNHTRNVHSMEDVIVKIIMMENEINVEIDHLLDLKADLMRVIKAVDNPEQQTLLELRYLCFHHWKTIADKMGYNIRHVFRIHDDALKNIVVP